MQIMGYICDMGTLLTKMYSSGKTVFSTQEIRLLDQGNSSNTALPSLLSRLVSRGDLQRLRSGVYALPKYDVLEFANKIFRPSYISMESVLVREGVIFQYDNTITLASYQSRTIYTSTDKVFVFRKIAQAILERSDGKVFTPKYTIASLERAFLDLCYVDKWRTYENTSPIDKDKVIKLLPIYNNHSLTERVTQILSL